ncbi:hypothetical protein PoB_001876000 [Plakobranchus ocellatus]|uniref:Uncharacterized protein n=1 Tax=Plakobranchus ocellatus TaxID=259542 RepID=A0AAV3Z9P9_9GAST|nr:hypothetical protein PoB_001876000 [Plakobranchus ocellatus]
MSRFKFMEEFHAMDLSLFHSRKDICDTCVRFTVGEVVYNAHRVKADRAQKEKANNKLKDLTPAVFILYSDGCGYQNRNVTMSSALLCFAIETGKTVTQEILEKGHTMIEVDTAVPIIERHIKNSPIHCSGDYKRIIEESRRIPWPYVVYLEYIFFKDFSKVNTLKTIRPGRGKGKHVVTDSEPFL